MASKKSKILAMALCASVMTGIYASPVMADGQISGINVTGVIGAGLQAADSVSINGVELEIQPGGMTGKVKAAGGEFTQLTVTNGMEITGGGLTVGGTSIDYDTGNTVVGGTLTATKLASLNGGLTVSGGATVHDMLTASDGLTVTNNGIKVEEGGLTVDMGDTVLNDLSAGTTTLDRLTVTDGRAEFKQGALVEGELYATQAKVGPTGLEVFGGTTLKSTLNVSGDTTLANTTVGGTLTAGSGNFTVDTDGNTTIIGADKQLTVEGTAQIGTMTATTAQVGGDLTVGGDTTLAGLTAKGAADLQDGLTVSKGATVNGGLTVDTDRFVVDGVTGNTTVGGTLNVTGDTTLAGLTAGDTTVDSLTVKGAAKVNSLEVANSATVGDKLTVGNGLDVTGNALLNNDLTVNGATKLNGDVTVGGEAKFNEKATFNGKAIFNENIDVNGFANLNSGAKVNGELTVNGATKVNDDLTVNGDALVNGNFDVGAGNFKVDTAGNTEFNGNLNIGHDNFTVEAATGNTVVKGNLNLGSLEGREVGEAIKDLEEYAGELKDANLPDKVGGIERDPAGADDPGSGTTTIESGAEFTETAMTMGDTIVESGKITVGAEDAQTIIEGGAITAESLMLDGKDVGETIFGIVRDPENEVTTIEGATSFDANGMSIKNAEDFGTSLGVAGMEITAAGGLSTNFTAGGATFVGASGTTTINGGAIETNTINGVNFSEWHDEVDGRLDKLEYKTQNINGSEGTSAGTGEGGTAAGESIDVPATVPGHTGINGDVTVGGEINAGEIVVGDKDSDNKTTIDGGNITVNGGENGSTTINGGNITTGDITAVDGNFTGDVDITGDITAGTGHIGGIGMEEGTITAVDGNFTGDVDITGDITAGNGTIGNVDMDNTGITVGDGTTITEDTVTTDNIKANDGEFDSQVTVGGNTTITDGKINLGGDNGTNINADGMTVGTGENATSITNDTVKAQNGDFDNLTAGSGTFGTGNNKTVINNDGVTVGGENGSSITGQGITVGDKNGVSIKNDEVRVGGGEDGKGGSYMNDTDVVTGEGVSLNQTAERVGHLENRVGELEDRIDKVGAMSAAIANLRTMGYDPAAPTEIAVGVGQYRSETGAALGLFHYPNRDFMLSLSVSTSGDEVMGGIGATWKFGRKSPEKVAEIKKAQAEADARRAEEAKLAKAEEMKQAAKEAKIKAQQERHAKLAAERAAQAEAAK